MNKIFCEDCNVEMTFCGVKGEYGKVYGFKCPVCEKEEPIRFPENHVAYKKSPATELRLEYDYVSPVTMSSKIVREELTQKLDALLMTRLKEVDIQVDADELIKALKYDRNQYDKGYDDGYDVGHKMATKTIFSQVIAVVNKCVEEDGFYATDSDSDVSINAVALMYDLDQLAKEYGINDILEENWNE